MVSNRVVGELSNYENKYRGSTINQLKKLVAHPEIVLKFYNQEILKTRLTHAGHVDYLKSSSFMNSRLVEADNSGVDDDSKIILGLAREARNQNIRLILYTHDRDFDCRARSFPNLTCRFLDFPEITTLGSNYKCDWEVFSRFLYNLALTFGAIILKIPNNNDIVLFGIWIRKGAEEWENEKLRVYSKNPLLSKIKKDLNLLHEVCDTVSKI